jgi:flagellar hook protein FlgE
MGFNFSAALSGLRASSNSLSVAGNNIANANTTAFKTSTVSFADIYTNSLGVRFNGAGATLQMGNGVTTAAINTDFSQGTLKDSTSPTSAAIQGTGFFVVSDPSGTQSFTRAGEFLIDQNGFVVTPGGQRVQGYGAINGVIPAGAPISDIKVPIGEATPPSTTTQATLRANLSSTDPAGSIFHAPVRVFDSKGAPHILDLVYTKQADGSFLMSATLDGNAAQASVNGGAASGAPVSFTFDSNGGLTAPTSLSITPDQTALGNATLPSIDIILRQTNSDGTPGPGNFTNYAAPSAVSAADQDGFASGTLSGLSFSTDQSGKLQALFSNGQKRVLGQVVLATFSSQAGLRHLGGNLYQETTSSGQPSVGVAGTGGRGSIVGSAIEESNVSIADEFTELIVAQRSFQANSRVITTISQTLQDLIQII